MTVRNVLSRMPPELTSADDARYAKQLFLLTVGWLALIFAAGILLIILIPS